MVLEPVSGNPTTAVVPITLVVTGNATWPELRQLAASLHPARTPPAHRLLHPA